MERGRLHIPTWIGLGSLALGLTLGLILWTQARRTPPTSASTPRASNTARQVEGRRSEDRLRAPENWLGDPGAPAGAIEGVVRATDGTPVEGALVALINAEEDQDPRLDRRPAATRLSGHAGLFRLENVRPGRYAASATTETGKAFKPGLTLLPGETLKGVELVLSKEGVSLHGTVSDSGSGPVASAEIRAAETAGSGLYQAVSDAKGHYRMIVAPGNYKLSARAEGYAVASELVQAKNDQRIDFRLNPAAILRGRVVARATGEPVAEATVFLENSKLWGAARQVRSDALGVFEYRDVDPGDYELSAQKGKLVGHLPRAVTVTLAGYVEDLVISCASAASIAGHVFTSAGAPVAEARLRLRHQDFSRLEQAQARSSSDGSYRIEGVPPGKYMLEAYASAHAPARKDNLVVAQDDLSGVDLKLDEPAEVSGKVVTRDGHPVEGATVAVSYAKGGGDRTGFDGRFHLKDLPPGRLWLKVEHPTKGYAQVGPIALAAGEKKEVLVTLESGASVAGVVKWDDDGSPAAGITVNGLSSRGQPAQTISGPDGSFLLGPLPPGQLFLTASRRPSLMAAIQGGRPTSVSLEPNEHKTGVELTAARGGHKISGIVLDPVGAPVPEAAVSATLDQVARAVRVQMAGLGSAGDDVYSDSDGTFTLEDLSQGQFTVFAKHAGYSEAQVEHVAADSTGVRVQFKSEATLSGTVVARGKPVPDFTLSVQPMQTGGEMLPALLSAGLNRQSYHDASGAFEVHGLSAGRYQLVATTSDGRTGKQVVTLAEGEHKDGVLISIATGATVKGRLVEYESGAAIASAQLMVSVAGQLLRATTDAQGAFALEGMPSTTASLIFASAAEQGYVPDLWSIEVADGQDSVDLGTLRALSDPSAGPAVRVGAGGGLVPRQRGGRIEVAAVRPDSPAARAGLQVGEIIVSIDDKRVAGLGLAGFSRLLDGASGATVRVGVLSAAGGARTVSWERPPPRYA